MIVNPVSFKNYNSFHLNNLSNRSNLKNTIIVSSGLLKDTVSFGDSNRYDFSEGLPDVLNSDVEKAYAKHLLELEVEDWETVANIEYCEYLYRTMSFFEYVCSNPQKKMLQFINRVGRFRSELLNERITQKNNAAKDLEEQTNDEKIIIGGKMALNKRFLDKVTGKFPKIPTAIMIYSGKEENREKLIEWFKSLTGQQPEYHVVEFDHEDAYKTIYRLETETSYAQTRYDKSPRQTVVFINNFDEMLKEDNGALKNLLFENSDENKPITIVFQTQNPKELVSAYTGNAKRIPVKIKLDESIIPDDYLLTDRYTPYQDGFKYKVDKNTEVELYLGSFGTDNTTLWVNSSSLSIMKKILDNIRSIKQEEKFKNINKIQCYGLEPEETNYGFHPIDRYTKEYELIFQKDL